MSDGKAIQADKDDMSTIWPDLYKQLSLQFSEKNINTELKFVEDKVITRTAIIN